MKVESKSQNGRRGEKKLKPTKDQQLVCPLAYSCVAKIDQLVVDVTEIKTMMHGLLGNGQPGNFQKLESRVGKM